MQRLLRVCTGQKVLYLNNLYRQVLLLGAFNYTELFYPQEPNTGTHQDYVYKEVTGVWTRGECSIYCLLDNNCEAFYLFKIRV